MSMCHDCPEGHYSSAGATSCIPPAPTGFLSNATATSVTVQWEAIAAVSFETTINGTNKERHIENSRTFDNLLPGSVYIVKVVAIGANGVESSATTESIETMPDGVNTLGIALGVSGGVGALVLIGGSDPHLSVGRLCGVYRRGQDEEEQSFQSFRSIFH